jgi:hypothetical protein
MFAPRGVPHAFMVLSDVARLITIHTRLVQAFYYGASEPVGAVASGHRFRPHLRVGHEEQRDRNPRTTSIRGLIDGRLLHRVTCI